MNKFLVFPYENHIENILKSLEDKMYGRVEDILTLNGWWVKTKPEIHVGNKEIKIKKNIDEISKECNSLWVVESYFSLDFISEIVPILIYAKEKRWTVYYGRRTSDSEEKIIREIIDKNKLHMNEKLNGKNWEENRIYDIKSPVIWIVDMFPQMPMNSLALELWKAFEQQGYKTELISKRKDVSLVSKAISFPDIKNENKIEIIKEYNNFFEKIEKNNKKIVVLDDDPTGVQTVHDISVYTNWEKDTIRQGFDEENNLFYILTNSRGFTAEQTTKAHNEIAAVVDEVAKETGKEYIFISRSDSTLRGHYPLETELLKKNYEANTGKTIDGEILCPFFKEGGRFTIDNVHYVRYGEDLIPANETEFAKDKTFGYSAATMPEYVEEKTKGAYKASDVTCISLEDIHDMNIDKIEEALMAVKDFNKIIVNAVDYADVKVFCVALYRAMAKGKVFMFRTAAAIVKVMGGVTDQPLLSREQMVVKETDNGGIIVVGSHTDKTTKQVEELKKLTDIEFIELDATLVKDDEAFEKEVKRCLDLEETCIKAGKTVCCYTTRALITADTGDKEDELRLSVKISDAVQSLVGRLSVTPSFVIAKGGITSSDVGTKALAVKKANVLGQIKPGIPVWQTGEESKFPMTPYVIFPGNVGEITTLREAVEVLTSDRLA